MQKIAESAVFTTELMFGPDLPSGPISYTLRGNDGTVLHSDTLTTPGGSVSAVLSIPGSYATVGIDKLFESRLLSWSYNTVNGLVTGNTRYRVDAFLAYAASADGVRTKLGVLDSELPDEDIDLIRGFLDFSAGLTNTVALVAAATSGDRTAMIVIDGIEASAALSLLPTLPVKIAKARSSGTNSFTRSDNIDWTAVEAQLRSFINVGRGAIDVPTDSYALAGVIFAVANRTDAITG